MIIHSINYIKQLLADGHVDDRARALHAVALDDGAVVAEDL